MPTDPLIEALAETDAAEDAISVLTAGDILHQARQRLGLNEKEVADKLHITRHYVKALESNSYEKLPGAVFAKGYLKSYALLLGLDVEDLLSRYDEFTHQQKADSKEERRLLRARKKKGRNKPLVIISLLVFIAGFLGLWLVNSYFTQKSVSDVPNTVEPVDDVRASLLRLNELRVTTQPQFTLEVEPEKNSAPARQPMITPLLVAGAVNVPERFLEVDPGSIVGPQVARRIESGESGENGENGESSESGESGGAEGETTLEDLTAALQVLTVEQTVGAESTVKTDQPRLISIQAIGNDILRISFTGQSWIEVNDSESQQIYRDIRAAGDVLEITGSAPFNILLGDAPFTVMSLNGDEIDLSGDIRIDNSARLTVGL
jgi:cytoskeleton protein RodZ